MYDDLEAPKSDFDFRNFMIFTIIIIIILIFFTSNEHLRFLGLILVLILSITFLIPLSKNYSPQRWVGLLVSALLSIYILILGLDYRSERVYNPEWNNYGNDPTYKMGQALAMASRNAYSIFN